MSDLIVRADDAGSFPEANTAIVRAVREGWARNVGFMAPAPWFAEAAALIGPLPGIACGLHLTFSCEWERCSWGALTPGPHPWCDADGRCTADPLTAFQRGVRLDDLMGEARAQLAHARAHGLRIVYVDEHMGIGWWHEPGKPERRFADELAAWCRAEGLVWHGGRPMAGVPGALLHDRSGLERWLSGQTGPALLVTHPADDAGAIAADHLRCRDDAPGRQAAARAADRDLLLDRAWAGRIQAAGWRLSRYDELPAA